MLKRPRTFLRLNIPQQTFQTLAKPPTHSILHDPQHLRPPKMINRVLFLPPQPQPKRMMIKRQGTFFRPALSQQGLPPAPADVPMSPSAEEEQQGALPPPQAQLKRMMIRRQGTFLRPALNQSTASTFLLPPHSPPIPSPTRSPRLGQGQYGLLTLSDEQREALLPRHALLRRLRTQRRRRDLHPSRAARPRTRNADWTQHRTTKMEEQRREFRKGQTGFELDSIFVCSASPLSDLGVSLDIKTSNHPKTVRDAIDKNDGLDEIAQSLWTIKIIAPDEFDEVVFPEEFNSISGAEQGSTGPKKPNLTISVPSGGDSDDKTKKVSRAFQKQKFQLTQILQLLTARIKDVTDTATLLQKKLPQQMAYIEGAPTIAKELCVLLEHGRLPDSQPKIAMRTFSMIVKVPKIVQVVLEECNFHPSVFRLDLDSGDCFYALVESIEKMIIKRKEEFSTRHNVIVYNIHSAYSRLKNTPQANILESCVATCVNSEVLAFAVIHLFDVSILGATSHWDTTIFDNASPQLLFIIVEKINKLLVQLSSRLCIPKPRDCL
ncbi:hypothetical protein BLNAU_10979 [Blattamonas nauphoetae]|uniref:Uncharacterized protein n=1 Tax=Blattamonas nauphoetae TaxID=2049346 RepID=A0ABQ9XPN5_9EUKA|nr:hypothetical protein BLNAU_10979 [Blattamonas nauphoetae]